MPRVFVRIGFGRHRKIRDLRKLLECDRHRAMGIVVSLWLAVMEQEVFDGRLKGWTAEHIAEECFWTEDPDTLVAALLKAGFLDQQDGDYCIHDWAKEQGQLIHRLAADRNRPKGGGGKPIPEELAEDHDPAAELVKIWNSQKIVQRIKKDKGIDCVEFYRKRGLSLEEMKAAISDPAKTEGKKLFEVLDAMEKQKGRPGVTTAETMKRIKEQFLGEGKGE